MSTGNGAPKSFFQMLGINTRRRNFFIKKRLQSRFMVGFAAIIVLGFIANLALAYFLIDGELARELYKIHLKIQSTEKVVAPVLWKLGLLTVPVIVIISSLAGRRLLKGVELPLMNFRKAVGSMGSGDLTVRLTEENLETLPAVFNGALDTLSASLKSLKERAADMERTSREIKGLSEKGAPAEGYKETLEKLSTHIEDFEKGLRGFRL